MDAKDLLDALHIIKHEDVYEARLKELKKAEDSFKDARFIAATVEQANNYRSEALQVKKEAEDVLEEAFKHAAQVKNQAEVRAQQMKQELQRLQDSVEKASKVNREQADDLNKRQKLINEAEIKTSEQFKHWKAEREMLRLKIQTLREAMEQLNTTIKGLQ